jgi:hypothetical protein
MKNTAKSLENKQILVVNAITRVNSVSKKSRITNQIISMGPIVFERIEGTMNDGAFFGPFVLDGKEWRAFLRFSSNTIELDQFKSSRSKSISIQEFQVL